MQEKEISFGILNTLRDDFINNLEVEGIKQGDQLGYVACNSMLSKEHCDSLQQKLTECGAHYVKCLDASSTQGTKKSV